MHKALKQAANGGLIPRNVTEAVKAPRPDGKEMEPLTPEQARTLLEAARGEQLEDLNVLLYGSRASAQRPSVRIAHHRREVLIRPGAALDHLRPRHT